VASHRYDHDHDSGGVFELASRDGERRRGPKQEQYEGFAGTVDG
jgi:hypothetical protein